LVLAAFVIVRNRVDDGLRQPVGVGAFLLDLLFEIFT